MKVPIVCKKAFIYPVFAFFLFIFSAPEVLATTITIDDDSEPSAPTYLTTDYPDAAKCIQTALDNAASGDTIVFREGTYGIARQIKEIGKDLTLTSDENSDGTADYEVNFNIAIGDDDPGFYFAGTTVKNNVLTTADASIGASAVTFADLSGVATGDLVRITNNTIWSPKDDDGLRTGELYTAQSVAGNTVTLSIPLLRDYTVANGSKALIYHAPQIHIFGLRFFGVGPEANVRGVTLEYCKNSSILNSYFENNGMAAMYLATCDGVEVAHNTIYKSNMTGYGYGVSPINAAANINIHDNIIRGCRHEISSGASSSYGENRDIVITHNDLHRDNGKSVVVDSHQVTISYTVTDNDIYPAYYDEDGNYQAGTEVMAFFDGTVHSVFENNRVYGGTGISHRGNKSGATKIIKNNTFYGADSTILTLSGGEFDVLDVENNTMESTNAGSAAVGITLYNDLSFNSLTIKNNNIKGDDKGIYIDTTNATNATIVIQDNIIQNSGTDAMQVDLNGISATSNIDVSGNHITTASKVGIRINLPGGNASSSRKFHDNYITNVSRATGGHGFWLVTGTDYVEVYHNQITDDSCMALWGVLEADAGTGNNSYHDNRIVGMKNGTISMLSGNGSTASNNDATDHGFTIAPTYTLTVNGGTGSGSYAPNTAITITAAAAPTGKIFDWWTGASVFVTDVHAASTIFTMPAIDTVITASYLGNPTTRYSITVIGGTGNAGNGTNYVYDESVAIKAGDPPFGKVFDKWTGDTDTVTNIYASSTTVRLPLHNITLTATWKDPLYALTVNSGLGSGTYLAGTQITVVADPAFSKVFARWTGYTTFLSSTHSATATFTMPTCDANITAVYNPASDTLYALTVTGGTGSGSYTAGYAVNITAGAPAAGKVFDHWTGDTDYVSDASAATTVLTMPARATTLTAIYRDSSTPLYALTVTGGIGSGSHAANSTVVIAANPPATGKVFDRWTGADSNISDTTAEAATITMPTNALTVTAVYKDIVSAPVFSLASGSYSSAQSVMLSSSTEEAIIRYTTDGTAPTVSSALYNLPITVSSSTTIKARAFKDGCADSDVALAVYAISTAPEEDLLYALTITGGIGSGSYVAGTMVIVAANPPADDKVFDRWIGDTAYIPDPTTEAVTVTMPNQAVHLTATYKDICISPVFSLASGSYSSTQSVAISTTTAGAEIYYTTNGSTPNITSAHYTGAISISSSITIRAIAIKAGCADSSVAMAVYAIYTVSSGGGGGGSSTPSIKPTITEAKAVSIAGDHVTLFLSVMNASSMSFSATSDFKGAVWENYAASKIYTKATDQTKLYIKFKSSTGTASDTIIFDLMAGSGENTSTGGGGTGNTTDSSVTGTLLKVPDSFKVYVIINGKKKWISTPEVFEQLGYQWTNINIVTPEQLSTYADYEDNLIREIGDYKVYLVVNGVRRHIPNPEIFLDYGFAWGDVKDVLTETINKYKPAFLLKESGKDGIYYITDNVRKLIPTTAIFDSYGDKTDDVQIVSKAEMESYSLSNLIKLAGANDIYLVEGNTKKRIPSPEIFKKYGLNWNYVINVNQTEFDFYQDGGELSLS